MEAIASEVSELKLVFYLPFPAVGGAVREAGEGAEALSAQGSVGGPWRNFTDIPLFPDQA